ncbi:MAG: hypothetical protein KDD61_12155 [Bdellovibrionales bacterium]|nr:hypothetical protein [Bdellovibrionales bacterium]
MNSQPTRFQLFLDSKMDRRFGLPTLVLVVLTLFFFQNCADPLQLADEEGLSVADSLPFAFDVNADHISYMSCSDMPPDYPYRAFYTFRVGAYDEAGIKFTDEFLSRTGKYKASERATYVSESAASQGASIQLSIRQKTNYQGPLVSSSTPVKWHDFETMLAPLDSQLIVQKLSELESGQRVNYFAGISGLDNRQVEGNVRFTQTESLAADVRAKLMNTTLLTLTYTDPAASDELVARGATALSVDSVYGRGYEIDFKKDGSSPIGGLRRSLSRITEIDLSTKRTVPATWDCSNGESFMIVRMADVGKAGTPAGCSKETGPPPQGSPQDVIDAYNTIRKVLRPEDWYVDPSARCVIPRLENYCYGNDAQRVINYTGTCDPAKGECPHFVSICKRISGD